MRHPVAEPITAGAAPHAAWRVRTAADRRLDLGIAAAVALVPLLVAGLGLALVPDFAIGVDDSVSSLQPNTSDAFRQLSAGELPLWSHHTLCGMPLYSRGQLLHPGSLVGRAVCLCTGVRDREVAFATLFYLLAGTFCSWFYLRYHGCLRIAATIGAIAFACSGPFWGYWTNWNTYSWAAALVLPTLLAIDVALAHRGTLRDGWRQACLVGLTFSPILLIADPQLIVKTTLLSGGYVLLRADRAAWRRGVPVLVAGAVLAGCCGLAQCLAVRDYVGQSTRVTGAGVMRADFFAMSVPATGLLGLVDPFLRLHWVSFGTPVFHGAAIGVGPLLPVVAGVLLTGAWWRRNVTRTLSLLAAAALVLSVGLAFPPNRILLSIPVINNFRWPLRWMLEACTVGALVVGLASDRLIRAVPATGGLSADARQLLARCGITFGILWVLRLVVPPYDAPAATTPVAASLAWCLAGAGLLAMPEFVRRFLPDRPAATRLFPYAAVALAALGGIAAVPTAQRQRFADPDLRNLLQDPLEVRVGASERVWPCLDRRSQMALRQGGNLVFGMPHQFGTRSVSGYCFRLPWQDWRPFMDLQGQIGDMEIFHTLVLDPKHKGLLNVLRVGALAIAAADAASRKLLEAHPDFSLQYAGDQLLVFRHAGFREPAWFVEELLVVPPGALPLHTIDTTRTAVARDPQRTAVASHKLPPGCRVTGFDEHHARIDVAVDCPESGLLVLSNAFYPGWTATIDGVPAAVGLVNRGFMAVEVPKGSSRVSLRYAPRWLINLIVFSGLCWIGLIAASIMAAVSWRSHGRNPPDKEPMSAHG